MHVLWAENVLCQVLSYNRLIDKKFDVISNIEIKKILNNFWNRISINDIYNSNCSEFFVQWLLEIKEDDLEVVSNITYNCMSFIKENGQEDKD